MLAVSSLPAESNLSFLFFISILLACVHSVNFAAKLVHIRRALSSTVINSHQEPVSGQACNPPDPH
jgi:hypothetical protein